MRMILALCVAGALAVASQALAFQPQAAGPGGPILDPDHHIPPALLSEALASLSAHKAKVTAPAAIGVVDLSRFSGKPRFYLLDMQTGAVFDLITTHGKGSDPAQTGRAIQVSNARGSQASSLGGYVTAERYFSDAHLSDAMRLDGLDSTNSQARCRCVVIHAANRKDGSNYASSAWIKANGMAGRSDGCLAFTEADLKTVLTRLPAGSFIYVGPASLPTSPAKDVGKCAC